MFSQKRLLYSSVPLMALVGGVAGGMLVSGNGRSAIAQSPAVQNAAEKATATSLENAFEKVSDTIGPATVYIEADVPVPASRMPMGMRLPFGFGESDEDQPSAPVPPRTSKASGSGVVVRSDGYILTNDHVIENAVGGKVTVKFPDGTSYPGTVTRDRQSDLALVKIKADKPLPTVKFANSDKLRVGQWAVAIGSPFGQQNTMTTGIVSALHRKTSIGFGMDRRTYPALLQTDAAINQGNSGGPLLNIDGELIGINVALYSPTGTSAGIGFAIPSNSARNIVEQLLNKGKVTRGFLGVAPEDLTPEDKKVVGEAVEGAIVRQANDGTPAAQAGIKVGDVITRFNGVKIVDEISLRDAIGVTPPGKSVAVDLLREKKPLTVTVTLAEAPTQVPPPAQAPNLESRAPSGRGFLLRDFGMMVSPVTDEIKVQRKMPGLSGVLVTGVLPGGAAADSGLAPGTVIVSVAGKAVTKAEDLKLELAKAKKGEALLLRTIARNGQPGSATITAP